MCKIIWLWFKYICLLKNKIIKKIFNYVKKKKYNLIYYNLFFYYWFYYVWILVINFFDGFK